MIIMGRLLASFLFVSSFIAFSSTTSLVEFKKWSETYLPDASQELLSEVYPVWLKNAEYVKEHNSRLQDSYTLALNQFAHMVRNTPAQQLCHVTSAPHLDPPYRTPLQWLHSGQLYPSPHQLCSSPPSNKTLLFQNPLTGGDEGWSLQS